MTAFPAASTVIDSALFRDAFGTPAMREIFSDQALIRRYIEDTGYPPTRADIARELGFRSANAAEEHLRALERKGILDILPGASRGIQLKQSGLPGLPLVSRMPRMSTVVVSVSPTRTARRTMTSR